MNTFLREAHKDDVNFLFHLVNEPLCRLNSLNTKEINYTEHTLWFNKILNSHKSNIYIYTNELNELIGQGRLDYDEYAAYISYSIVKQYRGQGHGKIVVKLLENKVLSNKKITTLHAKVKRNNVASRRIFESSNYKFIERTDYIEYIKDINCKDMIDDTINTDKNEARV